MIYVGKKIQQEFGVVLRWLGP